MNTVSTVLQKHFFFTRPSNQTTICRVQACALMGPFKSGLN